MITNILVGIIILHLVVGFGFMIWKLSGSPKTFDDENNPDEPK
jgi:hypothetical protein